MIKIYGHKIATRLEVAKIIFWALNFRGEEEGNGYLLSVKTESRPSRQFQSCKKDKYIHEVNHHWGPGPLPAMCVQGSVTSMLQFTWAMTCGLCAYAGSWIVHSCSTTHMPNPASPSSRKRAYRHGEDSSTQTDAHKMMWECKHRHGAEGCTETVPTRTWRMSSSSRRKGRTGALHADWQ